MKRYLGLVSLAMLFAGVSAQAQPETTSMSGFMDYPDDARTMAMGGASLAADANAFTIGVNPAGMVLSDDFMAIGVNYMSWSASNADYMGLSGFLNIMLSGVLCYSVKGKDLVPYPDLALCGDFNRAGFEIIELSKQEALLYMKKENFSLPAGTTKGYLLMAYRGVPLGFVKNIGSRFNNLWPVSRRIRMSL